MKFTNTIAAVTLFLLLTIPFFLNNSQADNATYSQAKYFQVKNLLPTIEPNTPVEPTEVPVCEPCEPTECTTCTPEVKEVEVIKVVVKEVIKEVYIDCPERPGKPT